MNRLNLVIGITIASLLTGCLAGPGGSIGKTDIHVAVLTSSPVKVASYHLREAEGKLVVSGRVSSLNPIRVPGHVDLTVCDPEGTTIGFYQAKIFNHASKRGGLKEGQFVIDISPSPAMGSQIVLGYDQQAHEAANRSECALGRRNG